MITHMKRTKPSFRAYVLPLCMALTVLGATACRSAKKPAITEEKPPVIEEAPALQLVEPEPLPVEPPPVAPEPPEPEAVELEPVELELEAPVEVEAELEVAEGVPEPEDIEYLRSIGDIVVDHDTYTHDKEAIMHIIADLAVVMDTMDYNRWLTYIDNASKTYWSRRSNLQRAEKKLPVKGLKLQNLQDYFKHVFVPARKGREVTEIRYVSDTYVKAVQVEEDRDIVFYYFNKIDGKWLLHQPPLEN